MAENTKRYECVMLGHNQPLIQQSLDKIGNASRVVGVVAVGVNVLAIIDHQEQQSVVLAPFKKARP